MKHPWYKEPKRNPYNGRLMSVPYGEDEFHIEPCSLPFSDEMLSIYRPYVEKTAVSFEITVPTLDEFAERVRCGVNSHYPWLLACVGDRVVGYAYAGPLKTREAYRQSVELSIYLRQGERGKGYGRRLYVELERELRTRGFTNSYACIAYPGRKDPYLTRASVRFHAAMGYRRIGKFTGCAKKFGRLYSMVWMGKRLGRTVVSSQYWNSTHGFTPEDVRKEEWTPTHFIR